MIFARIAVRFAMKYDMRLFHDFHKATYNKYIVIKNAPTNIEPNNIEGDVKSVSM